MNSFRASCVFVLISFLSLSGCSTTQQAYIQNIKMYLDSDINVTVSNDDIRQSKADLIYVVIGERPRATMALAFIENGQYKWLSQDKAMFITENGRLVRTVGLAHNLIYVSNLSNDPLKMPSVDNTNVKWNRVIDTELGDYGTQLSSQTSMIDKELLLIQQKEFVTTKFTELVKYQSALNGDATWTNIFWYDKASGQLLKSSQKTSAQSETIEITYISRAIRLLGE
jgi:hypothetical protein